MDSDMQKFGFVERVTLASWMLIIGAWVAASRPAYPEVGTVLVLFNLVAAAMIVGGGPVIRGGLRWVRPRAAALIHD